MFDFSGEKGKSIFDDECPKVEQSTSLVLNRATTSKSMHPSFKLVVLPSFIISDSLVSICDDLSCYVAAEI